jgi:diacylglycerol O-acyltransferase / wax synthase
MKKLHLIDDAFLRLESRNQPLHIGVLMLFEPPEGEEENFAAELAQKLRSGETAEGLFNQRLVEKRGLHYWQEDDDFDLAHHFVHLALPKPGRIRELFEMISRLHCGHLDRAYPLWRFYLIEGIEDGRVAVYLKIHHSMADGMGCMELLVRSMATDAEASKSLPPLWEIDRRDKGETKVPVVPFPVASGLLSIGSIAGKWRTVLPVIRKLRKNFKDFQKKNPNVAMAGKAPKCVFNQPISGTRRIAAQSYSRERIKNVSAVFSATNNDVILAMVAGALRKYLEARNEFTKSNPLLAGIPISVRGKGNSEVEGAANEVAFALTSLATDIDDPVERMRIIKGGMDYNKAQLNGLSAGQIQAYASLSLVPGAFNMLFGRKPENTVANLCISHVPGPKGTFYWQGAKLGGVYPISLVIHGSGINITIISGSENVDFGIIACRKTVPHVQRLLDYLEDALAELEEATKGLSVESATEKKPVAKKAKTVSKKVATKKAPVKKSVAKKAVAKKAPPKKAAARKAPVKKAVTKAEPV